MKKAILLLVLVGALVSCGVTKTERQSRHSLKGDWSLSNVTYPGSAGFVDVTLFEDAATKCFRNSDWHFISNNNSGSYELYKSDCAPGVRQFHWDIAQGQDGNYYFTLKPEFEDTNARRVKSGYRLKVVRLDGTQMVLDETVSFNGKPFVIRMTFNKY